MIRITKKQILDNQSKSQVSYFLQEILFETKNNSSIQEKYNQIKISIKNDGFEKTAVIFSISDTSTNGGSIGWIKKNSLNPKIYKELEKIEVGEYSKPIVIPGGFLILKIKDIKTEIVKWMRRKNFKKLFNKNKRTIKSVFSYIL